jgi:hypothetical protein
MTGSVVQGLPDFLLTDRELERRAGQEKQEAARRMLLAVPWDPAMKWQPQLNIQASTYKALSLFKVRLAPPNVNKAKATQLIVSPGKQFCYREVELPAGKMLSTAYGEKRGDFLFDGPVVIPALHEKQGDGTWSTRPWMSITPMEILTLRSGTRHAKGSVIVAGLGLGHQLIEVSKRPQVKKLVLIERSRDLVDWLLPRIRPHLGRALDDVVVEDAYEALPKMSADVALIDIFPSYGGNDFRVEGLRRACRRIEYIWGWGA